MNGSTRKSKKKLMKQIKIKTWQSKPLGCGKSGHKREIYYNTGLLQEARKISNKQPNLTPKGATRTTKHKVSKREIKKNRAEINDIKTKNKNKTKQTNQKALEQINEPMSCFFEKINKIDKPLARLIKKKGENTL